MDFVRRNAIALAALFVALGGTGYAAVALPKNSVGTPQIKKDAVTTAKVKNGSLLRADFKAGQLPAGPAGPQGAQGPQGPVGPPGAKGDAGAAGQNGTNGQDGQTGPRGPSNGRYVVGADDADIDGTALMGPLLNGGEFLVTAKVNLDNQGGAAATATCTLTPSGGSAHDTAVVDLGVNNAQDQATVTLLGHYEITGSNFYILACNDGGGTVDATNVRMQIIQLDDVATS